MAVAFCGPFSTIEPSDTGDGGIQVRIPVVYTGVEVPSGQAFSDVFLRLTPLELTLVLVRNRITDEVVADAALKRIVVARVDVWMGDLQKGV